MATTSGIYEIRNKITGHCYIGSAVNVAARKRKHFWRLRKGNHHSSYLQNAFNKYGEEVFEVLVVEEVPDTSRLIEREQYWIEQRHPKYNMNPLATSRLGMKLTEEAKAKLREYNGSPESREQARKLLVPYAKLTRTEGRNVGIRGKNSEEHNRKIAESHMGMKQSPEGIEKMRLAKTGKKQSPEVIQKRVEGMMGHVVSEESRRKNAESNKATWAKKTVEEKHAIATNRPPISEVTRQRLRESHQDQKPTPEQLAKKAAVWASKTEEEKAAISAKRKATWAAKRNQSPERS